MPSSYAVHWDLDPDVAFLNHGSFGACPITVLDAQARLRRQMEREPVRFFLEELPPLWDAARSRVASLVNARAEDLAFVPNASTGVNTVLRSARLAEGDEVLFTNHGYGACNNAARRWAEERGATAVVATIPFPCGGPDEVVEAVMGAVTARTRLAIVDHVTSSTGLVLPIERLVPALKARGVETLIDGAHALGMLPLDLDALGAGYYTANAHKWLCAPKGAAILHVRADLQESLRPLVTSHGMTAPTGDRSRFWQEMDWVGTQDPTAWLTIPAAIDFLQAVLPDGLEGVQSTNHAKVIAGRARVLEAVSGTASAPESMLGSLAAIELRDLPDLGPRPPGPMHALYHRLVALGVQVPVFEFEGRAVLRISAQLYNGPDDYERLAEALEQL